MLGASSWLRSGVRAVDSELRAVDSKEDIREVAPESRHTSVLYMARSTRWPAVVI